MGFVRCSTIAFILHGIRSTTDFASLLLGHTTERNMVARSAGSFRSRSARRVIYNGQSIELARPSVFDGNKPIASKKICGFPLTISVRNFILSASKHEHTFARALINRMSSYGSHSWRPLLVTIDASFKRTASIYKQVVQFRLIEFPC